MRTGDDEKEASKVIALPVERKAPSLSLGDGPGSDDARLDGLAFLESRPPGPALLAGAVEAVLFTTADPLPFKDLLAHLDDPEEGELQAALALVQARYERGGHGLQLVEVAGGWQIRTRPRFARWVTRARGVKPVSLSRAALETLAIVAYEQPVTRADVENIRGVDPGPLLRMLVERGLLRTLGRKKTPGLPLLYGTSDRFLETFGLRDLSDLPTLRDLRELTDGGERIAADDDGDPWERSGTPGQDRPSGQREDSRGGLRLMPPEEGE